MLFVKLVVEFIDFVRGKEIGLDFQKRSSRYLL
jgi:hypothetical protein